MPGPAFSGLLFRLPADAGPAFAALANGGNLGVAGGALKLEPLFRTDGVNAQGAGFAGAVGHGPREWYVARFAQDLDRADAWEAAYHAMGRSGALALAGAAPDIVEPDLRQQWLYEPPGRSRAGGGGVVAAAGGGFSDQVASLPNRPGEFAWHLGDAFSQLRRARERASQVLAPGVAPVRIVHLDTGYDPRHETYPRAQVDVRLQKNFVDADRPENAEDRGVEGFLDNPGHGTGTLGILAGGRFRFSGPGYQFDDVLGGAPDARVVPVRVGNSVIQFNTSSVASGIAYAAKLCRDPATRVDVISMSMGGAASHAWADAVNAAYDAGVVFVAAAGNNISIGKLGGVPTRFIIYPARFRRVIAACGVMANGRPYYGLPAKVMQGNWGPDNKMDTAIGAYTPNVAWAEIGAPKVVDMDGAGTSSATPQVAAAAALYLQTHARTLFDPAKYPQPWMRVAAVRRALFRSAAAPADRDDAEKIGRGILRADDALNVEPPDARTLRQEVRDRASWAFLRALTGLGVSASPADRLMELEATQLAQHWARRDEPNPLEVPAPDTGRAADPDVDDVSPAQMRQFLEAVTESKEASKTLRDRAKRVLLDTGGTSPTRRRPAGETAPAGGVPGRRVRSRSGNGRRRGVGADPSPTRPATGASPFTPPAPPFRALRGFALDPTLAGSLDTARISEVTFRVPWEKLAPGPLGEYLDVVDVDPASGCAYQPVDLDDPSLLAQDGLPPSEGTPQFHQQMAYAVCALTIDNFEHALGRRALWRSGPSPNPAQPKDDSAYVQRLRVYPHALREPNAYYSPDKVALLFGYFNAGTDDPGGHLPGGRVFTCLSHDIVAHETTHALLDGMHRRFLLPTNPDVRAFHEAFADIVALFQHFTFPEILRHQIATTRGDVRREQSLLGELASQFGRATGMRGGLRSAIGRVDPVTGKWVAHERRPDEYERAIEPHDRGAVLVAAVFDAFLSIYERRVADLLRLATGGRGVLEPGAIHPDLVNRLADDASKTAQHVLTMCIRALDYCPPTDITFGEYLRAIVTADYDLVPDDDLNYRTAFVEAFRRRGIYPRDLRVLSVESLLWRGPADDDGDRPASHRLAKGLAELRGFAAEHLYTTDREAIFRAQRKTRRNLHRWLKQHLRTKAGRDDARFLGLNRRLPFEVHTARIAFRTKPDGGVNPQLLIGLLQDTEVPELAGDVAGGGGRRMPFEGGCTLVADLRTLTVQYCIRKRLDSPTRVERQQAFAAESQASLRATYFGARPLATDDEPFAALHRGV